MEPNAYAAAAEWPRGLVWRAVAAACVLAAILHGAMSHAATLSAQDLQTIGRAAAFMQPPPSSGIVAVVYDAQNPASRQDAEAIAGELDGGLEVNGVRLQARVVPDQALAGGGFALAIAAAGAGRPALGAAIRAAHILCVTAELPAVQAGFCTMAISSGLRLQIVLNHDVAAASGVSFAAAFRMMIREI